ncbi:hypothetical protein FQR65_LT17322 [Abscondita terminalis]|nr:hypothetical protein FQR65_LT17322 [Abscondita terminalis]
MYIGKPAEFGDSSNPDYIPHLKMGYRTSKALEDIVRELAEERNDDMREEINFELDSDDSDRDIETEEIITKDLHSSDSEQFADEFDEISDNDNQGQIEDDYRFFIRRDDEILWISKPISNGKTKAKNIIKILPSPKVSTRNIHREIDAFSLFIIDEMVDDITNPDNYMFGH